MNRMTRKKLIMRRRIFLALCSLVVVIALSLITFIVVSIVKKDDSKPKSDKPSTSDQQKEERPGKEPEAPKNTTDPLINDILNPDFEMLLLVNADNPLPEDYDTNIRKDLVTIAPSLRNNNYVTAIHKDVHPFITQMVSDAIAQGVDLKVWSPFRSYAIQADLFRKQVDRVGGDEEKAATVVARPGTSEHNTGLCADFNMASDKFETTPMYTWMVNNAENYGFVLRYPKDKIEITGVIYESWHWRFVGINHAKKMNELDMCLEEYVEYLKNQGNKK